MKVYELMTILAKLHANQDVKIQGETNDGEPFQLSRIDEGDCPDSTTLLIFDDSEICYNEDLEAAKEAA